MSKIVISGYYGFGNAGDEAMLSAILEAIFSVMPHAEVTVISGSPKDTEKKHAVKAVPRLSPFLIIKALKECDLLISGGGSLLQDVTSKRSLYYYLTVIKIAKSFNKPVMLYAQGIGPLQREGAKRSVGKILDQIDLITVRDERSKEELIKLGVKRPPIHVTADAVLSMHPVDTKIGRMLLKGYDIKGTNPLVGVSVRAWKDCTAYRSELAKALDQLHDQCGAHIVFIPMQHPSDTEEAKAIAAYMKNRPIVLAASYTTTELLALAGTVDLMIGVRLHALVFSSLMEKPVIGISYDPKIDNFLHMIGKDNISKMDALDGERIFMEGKSLLEDEMLYGPTLKLIRHLREESLKNAYMAFELLDHKSKI